MDTLNVSCVGNYSCWGGKFFADYAKTVTIYGEEVDALLEAEIYAGNVTNKVTLDCLDYGCQGTDIYLPNNPLKSELNCFGHGCYDMNIYINKGIETGFGKDNVKLNGCGICDSAVTCVSNWRISCLDPNAGHNGEKWQFDNLYNGTICSSTNCGCSGDLLMGIFTTNAGDDGCKVLTLEPSPSPTPAPTLEVSTSTILRPSSSTLGSPTTTTASAQQNGGTSKSHTSHMLIYVLIAIGSVLGTVILIGIGWYLLKKRKSKKVIHRVIKEIVEDEEVDKDTEMVLSENLNPQTTSKPYEKL